MKQLLLDTHILLWAISDDSRLPKRARDLITDMENSLFYSTASIWEISIKHAIKPDKMKISGSELAKKAQSLGCTMLPINDSHVKSLETLHREKTELPHNDPFDRIMLAQAKSEGLLFITHDTLISGYNEPCVIKV